MLSPLETTAATPSHDDAQSLTSFLYLAVYRRNSAFILPILQFLSLHNIHKMPLQIRPATDADGFRLGCIARDAFRDSLSRAMFPPRLHSKSETGDPGLDEAQWRATRTLRRMREGKPTFVAVDVPEQAGSPELVVGFAQWELPSQPKGPDGSTSSDETDEMFKDPLPKSLDAEKLKEMYEILELETKKALGTDGHSKMWCKSAPFSTGRDGN